MKIWEIENVSYRFHDLELECFSFCLIGIISLPRPLPPSAVGLWTIAKTRRRPLTHKLSASLVDVPDPRAVFLIFTLPSQNDLLTDVHELQAVEQRYR